MKKMLVFLFAVALMLVPMGAMATMTSISDSEMAAVTGQAGVSINVEAPRIGLQLRSITWGDPDGFTGHKGDFSRAGFVNLSVPDALVAHIVISNLLVGIDVGTRVSDDLTAVQIVLTDTNPVTPTVTLDAFMAAIYFDSQNAVAQDYLALNGNPYGAGFYANWNYAPVIPLNVADPDSSLNPKCVGLIGLSDLRVTLLSPVTLTISAH